LALASAEFFAKTAAPKTLYISDMKHLQLIGLIVCGALLISCETTQTAGMGNQERKRLAAIQQQQQEDAQMDESDRNLWNAHQDLLYTGTNPAVLYR
jgi:hypothetical protein